MCGKVDNFRAKVGETAFKYTRKPRLRALETCKSDEFQAICLLEVGHEPRLQWEMLLQLGQH